MITKDKINKRKIQKIVDKIIKTSDVEKIILFGSYAKNSYNENSDLDLLIIKETNLSQPKRGLDIRKSLWGIGVPIDIVVYTPKEIKEWKDINNSFISNIMKEGKVLYEKEKAAH